MSLILNKKIHYNYEILEKKEAGLELLGSEVKSIRNRQGNIDASYITIRGGEAFLMNADIPPYQSNNQAGAHERNRMRKVLLNKKELEHFSSEEEKNGLTIVPVSLYNKGTKIKLEIA